MTVMRSAALAFAGTVAALALLFVFPVPVSFLVFPVALSVFQFCATPFLRNSGLYRYHSEMLKATVRTDRTWEIHGGTSWDYVRLFRLSESGAVATRRLLRSYLEGLLDIARLVESGAIPPETTVTGTSYFFSEKSARRLGFRLEPAGPRLRAVLVLYYLDLVLLYSFARGRIAFPNVLKARRAAIRAADLAAKRRAIEVLIARLRREPAAPGVRARRASGPSSPPAPGECTRAEEYPAA
jgi:hypothetical protein